jgi:hypothetical protein
MEKIQDPDLKTSMKIIQYQIRIHYTVHKARQQIRIHNTVY